MAITVLATPSDPTNPENDVVFRQQKAAAEREDPREVFKDVKVSVEDGPVGKDGERQRSEISLRYAYGSRYIFAVYADNPAWTSRGRAEWQAAAGDAIEKFAAMRNLRIELGPRPEDTNRYNVMAEFASVIEGAS